jgi:acetate kinase
VTNRWILAVNGGSSSLKFGVFTAENSPARHLSGSIQRIGQGSTTLSTADAAGKSSGSRPVDAPDLGCAADELLKWLDARVGVGNLVAVGHRVVHGGAQYTQSQRITPELVTELKRLSPLDPEHLPGEIALIEVCANRVARVPQVACFDTAFHRHIPRVAQLLPIPLHYASSGIRRYGFHGLSFAYLIEELERAAGREAAWGRIIFAHLGSGASMAAVHHGQCLDTTMAFTPTAGLVMGTRTGDLDPGVLIYLMRNEGMNAEALDELVNRKSGLLGLSETSADVRDLLARRATDKRADDAISIFCYQARKWIGALAGALGGVDTLVFSGGIGENSPPVRSEICTDLEFLGVHLDASRNGASAEVISTADSRCIVRVIRTNEELMIAREVARVLSA